MIVSPKYLAHVGKSFNAKLYGFLHRPQKGGGIELLGLNSITPYVIWDVGIPGG